MTNKSLKVFNDSDVELVSRASLYDGFLKVDGLVLRHRLFEGGWSDELHRELLLKTAAVGVLLYDPDLEQVVLVRQFRVGALGKGESPWLLELVAGLVGEGEELAGVAVRESIEEADCEPVDLVKICDYYNSPGASDEKVTLFCGRVDAAAAGGVHGLNDEHEDIEVVVMDLPDALEAVSSGLIHNAMTIIALQWLQLNHAEVLERWH